MSTSTRRQKQRDQIGSILPLVAIALGALILLVGFGIDLSYIAYNQKQLNAAVDAAAIAGAQMLKDNSQADIKAEVIHYVGKYGSGGGAATGYNIVSVGQSHVNAPTITLMKSTSQAAFVNPDSTKSGYNAIKVTQTAQVNLLFWKPFSPVTISATASAGAGGGAGSSTPIKAVLVIDTTASMQDSDFACGKKKIQCALDGAKKLLKQLVLPNNEVALVTFPPIASKTDVIKDITNTSDPSNPTITLKLQNHMAGPDRAKPWLDSPSTCTTNTCTFSTLVPLTKATDYLSGGSLNPNNALVKAIGGVKEGVKKGIVAQGGKGTYIAQAIRQAQSLLPASSDKYTNAIILLSDGDAGTDTANMADDCFKGYISGATMTVTGVASDQYLEIGTNLGSCSISKTGSSFCPDTSSNSNKCQTSATRTNPDAFQVNAFVTVQTAGTLGNTGTYTTTTASTRSVGSSSNPRYFTADYDLLQCQQAAGAAREAKMAGTHIYVIGYSPATSGGCSTDSSGNFIYVPSGNTTVPTPTTTMTGQNVTPCKTLRWISGDNTQISTSPPTNDEKRPYFFSTSSSCTTTNKIDSIEGLFNQIGGGLSGARLIPDDSSDITSQTTL